jgi:hypothetical protein
MIKTWKTWSCDFDDNLWIESELLIEIERCYQGGLKLVAAEVKGISSIVRRLAGWKAC